MDNYLKDFKTFQSLYDMIRYAYIALKQFPKSEKFAMGNDIKRLLDVMLENCINVARNKSRKTSLEKMDSALAMIKVYVELSHDLGFLSTHKFGEWSKQNLEIGRMIGKMINGQEATVAPKPGNHRV